MLKRIKILFWIPFVIMLQNQDPKLKIKIVKLIGYPTHRSAAPILCF